MAHGRKEYSEENLRDPEVLELARKTEFILDEDLGKLPNSNNPSKVMIKMKNGAVYEQTIYESLNSELLKELDMLVDDIKRDTREARASGKIAQIAPKKRKGEQ